MIKPLSPAEKEENLVGINIFPTKDEYGNPATIIDKGNVENTRLSTKFGKNGERYCTVISAKQMIAAGDAIVEVGNELVTTVTKGMPSEESVLLNSSEVKPITSIIAKEENVDEGFFNLLDRCKTIGDVYEYLEEFGVNMSRTEQGVLSHKSEYQLLVGEDSEVFVNIGDKKYIKSEGFTSLIISKGTVFITSKKDNRTFSIVITIK